ncbi:serine/threonine-protein kinase SBK2-like [Hyla sarda]|uniref:serine/threonine-protein kinase SBK2-like n=1 Tax=Hyla sarda TaxID=327740 RepID=UPI0024C3A986|nr:serine/threonine-protein kinase SBK2-like [Hyla sarda]XP_056399339.1 serine/threonine-protein kinase SBK2-like [Hyla sarda]XP_056399340.1 serine/threonine-protein kinase SBK2-like [Hyla sarda]XP_056399341.1 serine/threonine-protein kinase SBK2-like [Hyla sarda]
MHRSTSHTEATHQVKRSGDMAPNNETEADNLLEEMMEITGQSLITIEVEDHYKFIKQLGKGKYGQVTLVIHRQKGTPMALKLLPKTFTKRQSFLYEYCVALSLSCHPNIIGMFGIAFESSEHYGFLYEVALHQDLISIIKPTEGVPEPIAKVCTHQLVSALEFIHSRGLVYRDVKPENVLLFGPDCQRIKLTDFGLTRPKGTMLKLVSGVIPYTAPELSNTQHGEAVPIDFTLDAWAFGVLLFCLITGYFPWEKTLSSDPFFDDFIVWQETGRDEHLAWHWKKMTSEAMDMLKHLMDLNPCNRSPVNKALWYLDYPWRADNWK